MSLFRFLRIYINQYSSRLGEKEAVLMVFMFHCRNISNTCKTTVYFRVVVQRGDD